MFSLNVKGTNGNFCNIVPLSYKHAKKVFFNYSKYIYMYEPPLEIKKKCSIWEVFFFFFFFRNLGVFISRFDCYTYILHNPKRNGTAATETHTIHPGVCVSEDQQLSEIFRGIPSFLPSIMLTRTDPPSSHLKRKKQQQQQHNLLVGVDTWHQLCDGDINPRFTGLPHRAHASLSPGARPLSSHAVGPVV